MRKRRDHRIGQYFSRRILPPLLLLLSWARQRTSPSRSRDRSWTRGKHGHSEDLRLSFVLVDRLWISTYLKYFILESCCILTLLSHIFYQLSLHRDRYTTRRGLSHRSDHRQKTQVLYRKTLASPASLIPELFRRSLQATATLADFCLHASAPHFSATQFGDLEGHSAGTSRFALNTKLRCPTFIRATLARISARTPTRSK